MASFFVICLLIFLAACDDGNQLERLSGKTMGTSYHITLLGSSIPSGLDVRVQDLLNQLDMKMTTYNDDSELNWLNRAPLNEVVKISTELMDVLVLADDIYRQTEGAFDPSVGRLVDLWGFGPSYRSEKIPTGDDIEKLVQTLGFDALSLDVKKGTATRLRDISLDLSAIAKGYAVDKVGELFKSLGLSRYMIEIGGEMLLAGLNQEGMPWRIAIERPVIHTREVQRLLSITNKSVATSGDYRNYFEREGKRYSHTLDPRTGFPITHNLVSVTVVNEQSGRSDALATAFMVMGAEQTLDFAKREKIAVFILTKSDNGFVESSSEAFKPYLQETN